MPTEEEVIGRLKQVMDPHTQTDVYSMGLISDLYVSDNKISLTFTPTSPFCPMGVQLAVQIKKELLKLDGINEDKIEITIQGHINAEQINQQLASKGE